MKRLSFIPVFAAFLFLNHSPAFAQAMEDVVYFKNGAVLHGQVLEQWPGVSIKIQSHDGTVHAYRMSDVSKIVKFELPPDSSAPALAAPPLPSSPSSGTPAMNPDSRAGKVGFGLMAGANLANDGGGSIYFPTGSTSSFGFAGGCFVDFGLSDLISLQPELYFTMKGAADASYGDTLHMNYVELPILFKLNFPGGKDLRFDLFTGPAISVLTSSYVSYQGVDYPLYGYENVDAGWVIGTGLEIGQFLVNLRYEDGLVPTDGYSYGPTNSVLSLLVGCRLLN